MTLSLQDSPKGIVRADYAFHLHWSLGCIFPERAPRSSFKLPSFCPLLPHYSSPVEEAKFKKNFFLQMNESKHIGKCRTISVSVRKRA